MEATDHEPKGADAVFLFVLRLALGFGLLYGGIHLVRWMWEH